MVTYSSYKTHVNIHRKLSIQIATYSSERAHININTGIIPRGI